MLTVLLGPREARSAELAASAERVKGLLAPLRSEAGEVPDPGATKERKSVSDLMRQLGDQASPRHWDLREEAARALGSRGSQAATAIPDLIRAAETDGEHEVREAAEAALALRSPNDRRDPWAIETLKKIGPAAAKAMVPMMKAYLERSPVVIASVVEGIDIASGGVEPPEMQDAVTLLSGRLRDDQAPPGPQARNLWALVQDGGGCLQASIEPVP
ncbi:MAG: hypothetical protein HY554_10005 [Elusimicrobia bacterium]|nr:hypothetical protein [Elusimicrobiota bacterium]